jgi:hypothetical protein
MGSASVSVTATAYQAIYIHHSAFDTTPYSSLSFWIHGGAQGGQRLQVRAVLSGQAQSGVALSPLTANTWQQITVSLSSLGAANRPNMDGIWIQDTTGATQPTFYVDDIVLIGAGTAPTSANLTINAGNIVRTIDGRIYGLNAAVWDSQLASMASQTLLSVIQPSILRFPGGSISDTYDWSTGRSDGNTWRWASSYPMFALQAEAVQAQSYITVNYGSNTPEMAAAWVAYANGSPSNNMVIGVDSKGRDWGTVGYWAGLRAMSPLPSDDGYNFLRATHPAPFNVRYWEIGNENYGGWENDQHGVPGSGLTGIPHDGLTYATYAKLFYQKMKAVDPTVEVGVVGVTGQDSWGNGMNPVPNPNEGGTLHSGWTPVVLYYLKQGGVIPDFLIHHRYPQDPGGESDSGLLQSTAAWRADALDLRKMLTDYVGAGSENVELAVTETNSVSSNPGKQSISLVNGLFFADNLAQLAQTEINSCVWWDFRNGTTTTGNINDSLYGWRLFGDYGIVATGDRPDTPLNTPYPNFYAAKLLTHWGRGGDRIVQATTDYNRLSVHAAKLANGDLALLVINKHPINDLTGYITLNGFTPRSSNATVYQYGKPQDLANADLVQATINNAGTNFSYVFPSYSMTVILLNGRSKTPFDFDGDLKTDLSIFRPSNGQWWLNHSSDGIARVYTFGTNSDEIVPADYDGDGKTDVAFWRPSTGEWFVLRSSNLTFFAAPFGAQGDIPAPGDFDSDGKADFTVFRPSNGIWYILQTSTGGITFTPFGAAGDVPVVGDYDGDGKSDVAIFRPSNGSWWMQRSTAGFFATIFGSSSDKPVQGDYTGDGKTDIAFWRPPTGEWFVLRSEDLSFYAAPFGTSGDTPVAGDYDGDGKADLAVFRPSGATWFVQRTTQGTLIQSFGFDTDIPVPSAFVP